MRLKVIDGCRDYDYTIDGTSIVDCPLSTVKDVLHKLIDKEEDIYALQAAFYDLVVSQGTYDFIRTCEQCEDIITLIYLDI